MSDTVKLIVTLNKGQYENLKNIHCGSIGSKMIVNAVMNGMPLDDVKAEIITERHNLADAKDWGRYYGLGIALEILDNIGKAEREE